MVNACLIERVLARSACLLLFMLYLIPLVSSPKRASYQGSQFLILMAFSAFGAASRPVGVELAGKEASAASLDFKTYPPYLYSH